MRLEIQFSGSYPRLDKYSKMYSLRYIDYDEVAEDILHSFNTDYDLYKTHLALFNSYRGYINVSDTRISERGKDGVEYYDGVKIQSEVINVSDHVFAMCCPLYIRKKWFDYDKYLGRFFLKCDLVYHLYN